MADITPAPPDDERWDEIIAGCRVLRARRELDLNASLKPPTVLETHPKPSDAPASDGGERPVSETAAEYTQPPFDSDRW